MRDHHYIVFVAGVRLLCGCGRLQPKFTAIINQIILLFVQSAIRSAVPVLRHHEKSDPFAARAVVAGCALPPVRNPHCRALYLLG